MTRNGNKKIKYIIISAVALLTFTATVAYAALNQQLIISGNVNQKGGNWNIYFSEPTVYQSLGSARSEKLEVVDATTLNISASLTQPGDSITYTFKVTNGGTINAKLYSWDFKNATEFNAIASQYSISSSLTYENGSEIIPLQDTLLAKDSHTLKLTFQYNGTQPITTNDVYLSMNIKLNYVQATVVTT